MYHGFWKQLPRPFMVQAPLQGYTDAACRAIIARYGKPDVMFTEFVPVDCLCSVGRKNIAHTLWMSDAERPVVAQVYGGTPKNFRKAAEIIAELGFDGMDINMGCPANQVEKRRGGSDLIKDPLRAREIIAAAKAGAGAMPVSVKTRLGYSANELESWLPTLLAARPAAITLHARTRDDTYLVPARWDQIARAVELARELVPEDGDRPLIIGNGDVASLADAHKKAAATGCDGVMAGRAIFGDPWFFNPAIRRAGLSRATVLAVMLEHTAYYIELYGDKKPLEQMKKHYKAYANGFAGASVLRAKLMLTNDFAQLEALVRAAMDE